jgi:hypothetical protein
MSIVQPESSLCVSKDQLQRLVGACALCREPSADQGWIDVPSIDASSRTYRWQNWITGDPKKIKALTFGYTVFSCVIAVSVTWYVMQAFVLPTTSSATSFWGLCFFVLTCVLVSRVRKSSWSDARVQIPLCDKHNRSSKIPNAGNTASAWRFWEHRPSYVVILGLLAYLVFVVAYSCFIATGVAALEFYLRYFVLPVVLLILARTLLLWILGIRRFIIFPYGVSSGNDIIEIWHFSPSFREAVRAEIEPR